jgi:hypothetical protein
MRKWSIQSSLVGAFALFVSLVLSAPLPSPEESFASGVVGAAGAVEVPPLGVSGVPLGESVKSEPSPGGLLSWPPSDWVPVVESWDARLARERAAAPEPVVVGFDAGLSVEDRSGRTSHGTTYRNADGSWTTVIDDHAVH